MNISNREAWSRMPAAFAGMILSSVIVLPPAAAALTIAVKSTDGPGEGFNDTTSTAPVGGNPATTLGAQRMFLFQHAADAWGLRLQGNIPIVVSASFGSLGGNESSAVLGAAAPVTVERDFPGSLVSRTWYPQSLANQLGGKDRNDLVPGSCPSDKVDGKCPEIFAFFNSDVDDAVLGAVNFYYGIDGDNGDDVDFLSVVLHEIGHGLGLYSLIDEETGVITPFSGGDSCTNCSDAYTNWLVDSRLSPPEVSEMSSGTRRKAIVDQGRLIWDGPATRKTMGGVSQGMRDGAPQIFAPTRYQPGSSVSHLDTKITPNELMEPYSTSPAPRNLAITLALLKDIGWSTRTVPRCGDVNGDRKVTTQDALLVMRGAVSSTASCPGHLCDVNVSGAVTAADGLLALRFAVGHVVSLRCPLA